jgi:LmbE family N-acetylglucosaminyl deacetylase
MTRRLLCVFAHPDDEVFCAGGSIAKYSAQGYEIMVVSVTKGDAGQIRDANIATRRTLGDVRAEELQRSCKHLGAQHAVCLDYGDGTLKDLDIQVLVAEVVRIIRQFRPDVVITFGPDGAYGHPDHIAIGNATTIACTLAGDPRQFPAQLENDQLEAFAPTALYHSYFPRNRVLMLETLSKWLVSRKSRNGATEQVDPTEFVRALLLFTEETTMLNYSSDRIDVNWYPSGFYIIEQGEAAKDLYLILSGRAKAVREHDDGTLEQLNYLEAGSFFGEVGLALHQRRNAHVIAEENVTCLVMSMSEAVLFAGRGGEATITGGEDRVGKGEAIIEAGAATHCVDVNDYILNKIKAMSAHRSQYPITPEMFPLEMLKALMGREYYVQVLPRPHLIDTLFLETTHEQGA